MKYDIHAYIIYYVEQIAICQENHLLLLLSDVVVVQQQEEESAPFAGELLTTILGGIGGVIAAPLVGEEAAALVAAAAAAAQPCLQGRERQLIHSRLTRRKYTLRLTKMPSNNMQALQGDEEVSVKAKNRLLTRSRGLL
ncbi:MAG TPA: hypothetical protein VJL79_04085 [Nitrososphaera sp.]|nr:hypothetical protein [Nitrososphaera sp.]